MRSEGNPQLQQHPAGSVLFLAPGYLAFIETSHAYWAWQPKSLSGWVMFVNFLGCVAFMVSAVLAFVPPRSPSFDAATETAEKE